MLALAFACVVFMTIVPFASAEESSPQIKPNSANPSSLQRLRERELVDAQLPLKGDLEPSFKDELSGSIGLGTVVVPRFEGGSKYIPVPYIPLQLKYKGFQLRTRGLGLEADVIPSRIIDAGPIIQARLGRNGVDDSRVDALNEVNPAMEVGGYLQINSPPILNKKDSAFVRASLVQDVVGAHRGAIGEVSTGYGLAITDKLRMGVNVSSSYASGDFMNSYFTVSPVESQRSSLTRFTADSGIKDIGATVYATYNLKGPWGISTILGYSRLLGDAANSSITQEAGNPNRIFTGLFVTRSFGKPAY